jgi:hypothetical protein
MLHDVKLLHNITAWKDKKVTDFTQGSEMHQSSAETPMICVLRCKVQLFGKQNTRKLFSM